MSTKDALLMIGSIAAGSGIGFSVAGIVAGIVGGFTGLGVLVVVYFIGEQIDEALRDHYRTI